MTTGAAETEALRHWVEQQHRALAKCSYYTLLAVSRRAPAAQVRDSYYKLAARLHPDRNVGRFDDATQRMLTTVYARIAEAYRVLRDPEKRVEYDRLLAAGTLRWEPTVKQQVEAVPNPHARRFYDRALAALEVGDARGALVQLKLAQSAEPENAAIMAAIADAEALLHGLKP